MKTTVFSASQPPTKILKADMALLPGRISARFHLFSDRRAVMKEQTATKLVPPMEHAKGVFSKTPDA
jgi:hypothetical protein